MKIIISRKGFDSGTCGVPDPILPDGTLIPFPIPDHRSRICFEHLGGTTESVGQLVSDLTGGRCRPGSPCHLDPDLDAAARPRLSPANAGPEHPAQSGL